MGSGFVLRDRGGRTAGYVMQGMGVVRCRASQLAQPAQLVLLRAGEAEERLMPAGGQEQTWTDGGGALTGAYIAADGEMLLDTGEAARQAFERARRKAAGMAKARQAAGAAGKSTTEQQEAAQPSGDAAGQRAAPQTRCLPQRRWPPPPCWPEARYLDGRWQMPEHHESG